MSLTDGSPTHEEVDRVRAFAERLTAYYGGELPAGANVNWNFASQPVVVLPLVEAERLLDVADSYRDVRQRAVARSCGCRDHCGDDGDTDGPGTCKGLPREPEPPPVEVVLVSRGGR